MVGFQRIFSLSQKLGLSLMTVIASSLTVASATAAEISLSQKSVAEMILKTSNKAREVHLKYEQTKLAMVTVLAGYDFTLSAETGYQLSKFANFTNTQNDKDETSTTTLSLKKPFTTGSLFGLEYSRTTLKSQFPITSTTTLPPQQTQDIFGLTLEQSLLKNSFGWADRAKVAAAEKTYLANQDNRIDDLQNVVLEGIRLYWKAFVAQETFQEALNSRGRYEKLVEAVRKKTSYGYSNPGELAQVQAELETRIQKVKLESTNYLAALDELITLLKLPTGSEVKFAISEELPPIPQLKAVQVQDLRAIRSLKQSREAADAALSVAKSTTLPDLALVGKYYQSGLDQDAGTSFSQATGVTKPKYYVGLKLSYSFGAGLQGEDENNKRFAREQAESQLARKTLDLGDSLTNAERKVKSTFAIAESAKVQKKYREKAASELNKAYTQGRADISTLITSLNNYFDSEIQYTRAIGDYQTALNEWAAVRDELIPDNKEETR